VVSGQHYLARAEELRRLRRCVAESWPDARSEHLVLPFSTRWSGRFTERTPKPS